MNDEQPINQSISAQYNRIFLDKMTHIVGLLIPIVTLPQVYQIFINHQTAGLSLFSWTFYLFSSALFAYYGITYKVKLLTITYVPSFLIHSMVVFGLITNR